LKRYRRPGEPVLDEAGREVGFTGFATSGFGDRTQYRYTVMQTHRKADYAPLVRTRRPKSRSC
jgi:hypothetical protein